MTQFSSLRDLSYFQTGGSFREFFSPSTVKEMAHVVRSLAERQIPYFLLGAGTNSLVSDEPWSGAVISFRQLKSEQVFGNNLVFGSGVENTHIARTAHKHGLAGAAWMYRLPGQIGATCRMNARCYGGEISQVVTKITAVKSSGEIVFYEQEEIKSKFISYKNTDFMRSGELICEVTLSLHPCTDLNKQEQEMYQIEKDREKKKQFSLPSCGCVFKNDYHPEVSVPSGLLLELSGAKSLSHGKVHVSPYHCNFIFNDGGTSRDVLLLANRMRDLVYSHFGVWLEFEMETLGHFSEDLEEVIKETRPPKYNTEALSKARKIFSEKRRP